MNKKRVIDYDEVTKLFDEEFKDTMQLIKNGETHLDNLADHHNHSLCIHYTTFCWDREATRKFIIIYSYKGVNKSG